MNVINWITNNYIEVFGALAGIIYVFLEVRQNIWLWPVGIVTSALYIFVFFTGKLYADMSLQGYYLVISVVGWYWWLKGSGRGAGGEGQKEEGSGRGAGGERGRRREEERGRRREEGVKNKLQVTRITFRTALFLSLVFIFLFTFMWLILSGYTDSPVPGWDSLITSLSIVATWMLARKIYEHWYLWMIVNTVSVLLFLSRGLYPTMILYIIYGIMSVIGLVSWRKTVREA